MLSTQSPSTHNPFITFSIAAITFVIALPVVIFLAVLCRKYIYRNTNSTETRRHRLREFKLQPISSKFHRRQRTKSSMPNPHPTLSSTGLPQPTTSNEPRIKSRLSRPFSIPIFLSTVQPQRPAVTLASEAAPMGSSLSQKPETAIRSPFPCKPLPTPPSPPLTLTSTFSPSPLSSKFPTPPSTRLCSTPISPIAPLQILKLQHPETAHTVSHAPHHARRTRKDKTTTETQKKSSKEAELKATTTPVSTLTSDSKNINNIMTNPSSHNPNPIPNTNNPVATRTETDAFNFTSDDVFVLDDDDESDDGEGHGERTEYPSSSEWKDTRVETVDGVLAPRSWV